MEKYNLSLNGNSSDSSIKDDIKIKSKKCKHRKHKKEEEKDRKTSSKFYEVSPVIFPFKKSLKTNVKEENHILNEDLLKQNKAKRKKTLSFSNNTASPTSGKVDRECTPHKRKKLKLNKNRCSLNFDLSSSKSKEQISNVSCGSAGMTDLSFVTSDVEDSLLVPSISETVEIKIRNNIKQKVEKEPKADCSNNDILVRHKEKKLKKYKKKDKKIRNPSKLILQSELREINDISEEVINLDSFEVDKLHSNGEVDYPFMDDSLTNMKSAQDSLIGTTPKTSGEVIDLGINIWNIESPQPNQNFPNQINETYEDFCSTINNSTGNVSLEDSVFASDVFSENVTEKDTTSSLNESSNSSKDFDYDKKPVNNGESLLENSTNEYPVYKTENSSKLASYINLDNALIVIIKPESKLYFHGFFLMTVLQGSVEILGSHLDATSKPYKIYSPRGSGHLYLQTPPEPVHNIQNPQNYDRIFEFCKGSISLKEQFRNCSHNDTILYCEHFEDPGLIFVEKHVQHSIFPKVQDSVVHCDFYDTAENKFVFEPNPEWDVLDSLQESEKVIVCGGKGVGKSTMLKYCINKLLFRNLRILVIDLDPGQPEFTLPGCVSAVVVTEPIFGPSYTQIRTAQRSVFVGNIEVSADPDGYLNAVREIIDYSKTLEPMVTLVNYMGYSKGLGNDLVATVIALLNPTIVVQIESKHFQRNFIGKLKPEVVKKRAKLFLPDFENTLNYRHILMHSMTDDNKSSELPARALREMRILWYFGKMVAPEKNSLSDSAIPAYEVNLSAITIYHNKKIVPPFVVNGNLVGLCRKNSDSESNVCVGWGVVRGIDLISDKLYLITPVYPEELEEVDRIVMGSVFLPETVYFATGSSEGLLPYVSKGVFNNFAQIPNRINDYNRRKVNSY